MQWYCPFLNWSRKTLPNPSCHWNLPFTNCFVLIHFDEFAFISRTKSDKDMSGFMLNKIWIWSGIPFIAKTFWYFPLTMPQMYLYNSSFQFLLIKFSLPFTAKITWINNWVNVFGIFSIMMSLLRSFTGWSIFFYYDVAPTELYGMILFFLLWCRSYGALRDDLFFSIMMSLLRSFTGWSGFFYYDVAPTELWFDAVIAMSLLRSFDLMLLLWCRSCGALWYDPDFYRFLICSDP